MRKTNIQHRAERLKEMEIAGGKSAKNSIIFQFAMVTFWFLSAAAMIIWCEEIHEFTAPYFNYAKEFINKAITGIHTR